MFGLQIKQVASATGLSEQIIRKWEQRYGAVKPERLENGYRVYSQLDVQRLLQIKSLVDQGYPVSQAVKFVDAQSEERQIHWSAKESPFPPNQTFNSSVFTPRQDAPVRRNAYEHWIANLLEAGEKEQVHTLDSLLHRAFLRHGLETLIQQIVLPFLRLVGDKWEAGEWSEDQEHLSSLTVWDFLIRRMVDMPIVPEDSPLLLTSCVPGERHDIMLHVASLEARRLGWNTRFLGYSPAPSAIENAVVRMQPQLVLLSITTLEPLQTMPGGLEWFAHLDQFAGAQKQTDFYLGGPEPILAVCAKDLTYIHAAPDLPAFLQALAVTVQK